MGALSASACHFCLYAQFKLATLSSNFLGVWIFGGNNSDKIARQYLPFWSGFTQEPNYGRTISSVRRVSLFRKIKALNPFHVESKDRKTKSLLKHLLTNFKFSDAELLKSQTRTKGPGTLFAVYRIRHPTRINTCISTSDQWRGALRRE